MSFAKLSLKGRALRYLAQREHSRTELATKLARYVDVDEGDDLDALLDELEAKNFISAERVVDSVLNTRANRFGASRIAQELRRKGLDADLVAEAVDRLRGTELQRAHDIWQRRFGKPPTTPQEQARQMRFLASRGFGGDVIRKVLQGQGSPENANRF